MAQSLVRRAVLAAAAVTLVLAIAGPARAEYQCVPGVAIPGGSFGASFVIAAPGCYYLAGNRNMTGAAPAIQINASHVYLDLRGRTLRHGVAGQIIISGPTSPITDVHVTNGKLIGAQGGTGVSFTGQLNGNFNISDLMITDDGVNGVPGIGILIGGGGPSTPAQVVIARNTIDVSRVGIALDTVAGSRIEDNVLVGPPLGTPPASAGIQMADSPGNDVRGNTISNIAASGFGAGIRVVGANSNYNNIQHNTISSSWDGIRLDDGRCNTLDWNVANGNTNSGITFGPPTSNNVYGFNRASGACTASGAGIQDIPGTNVNAGNNF